MKTLRILALMLILAMALPCVALATGEIAADPAAPTATLNPSDMFTDRDRRESYDTPEDILLSDSGIQTASQNVSVSGSVVTVTGEGVYRLAGSLSDGMVIIDADKSEKVQLVLAGVSITSPSSAAIYVRQADKVFITLEAGSENALINGGSFEDIDENSIEAVLYSRDDLTLNGSGSLVINSPAGGGIDGKDDLVITGGSYCVTAAGHGLEANDSIRVADGDFTVEAGKDALHASNSDDDTLGYMYIEGGSFALTAEDDGIHAGGTLSIAGGTIDISRSHEGLEGKVVDISGGVISVTADDDGVNAAGGADGSGMLGSADIFSTAGGAYISISGGDVYVNAEGDGLDANGSLYISGGNVIVSGPVRTGNGPLDYDMRGVISGGTFIAVGPASMAQNFGAASTQGSIMAVTGQQQAGSLITLTARDGMVLAQWTADKTYDLVIVSSPALEVGGAYTLTAGSYETEITLDSLIYGAGAGMMAFGKGRR